MNFSVSSNSTTLPSSYKYHTDGRVTYISFTCDKILKTIQALDPNEAQGYDGASIRMLKTN